MKVFITGATGFIGSFLAESLIQKNHEVRCLVRKTSNLRWIADLDIDCFYGSLFDKKSLIRGMEDCDIVYHAAGVTKARTKEEYFHANYEGTKNIVDAARIAMWAAARVVEGPGMGNLLRALAGQHSN